MPTRWCWNSPLSFSVDGRLELCRLSVSDSSEPAPLSTLLTPPCMSDCRIHTTHVCLSASERENVNERRRERRDGRRQRWMCLCCVYFGGRERQKTLLDSLHLHAARKIALVPNFSPWGVVKISFHPRCLIKAQVWQVPKSQNVNVCSPL